MVLLYYLAFVVLINIAYYLVFTKFSFYKAVDVPSEKSLPVSLIVCAKNEAENLKNHIPLWLQQDHPNYEVILINDASIDETEEIMESFAEKDPRIQIVKVKNNEAFWGNKKYALTLGLKRAKHQHLIFTDADCRPNSDEWLSLMASKFSAEKKLVLGYGGYEKLSGFLNKIIRFETLITAVQYLSYAKAGTPYMGVGRNLAYTAQLYYDNNGFISHIKLPSGDDDLFVNETATNKNTAICVSEKAFTYSAPKKTWKSWRAQKKRHFSTSSRYKTNHKFLLGLYYFSKIAFWALAAICLLFSDWEIALVLIGIRFLIQYIIVGKAASKLKEKDLIPFIPFLELFLVFLQMSIFIAPSPSEDRWS